MNLFKISRRSFLKLSAGATTFLAGSYRIFKPISAEPNSGIRDEKSIPSVCLQCDAGCGIKARVVNEKVVKIEGNPIHPVNNGKLCPKGHAGLQVLYNPDRIKGPLKRVGERGSGEWKEISWNEAIDIVSENLKELREKGEPQSLVFMTGRVRGQMKGLIERFMKAFGSPNIVGHDSLSDNGSVLAHYLMQGVKDFFGYDFENANYILSFGLGFIETSRPTVHLLKAFGHLRRERILRAKIVQVDTRFSVSAAKADEWIPIKPGTDGALALGIAHVILREKLYDEEFLENTQGFDLFKELVLEEYSPETVSKITGILKETIERIAIEFAETKPQIALGGRGAGMQTNGIYNRMAIHALNALVGNINKPGGILIQKNSPFSDWSEVFMDEISLEGTKKPRIDSLEDFPLAESVRQLFPDVVISENPYKINALFLYYTNPLFSSPNLPRYYKAFEKIPFIVDFTPFPSDSSEYVDLILPDHTYLERWHDDVPPPSLGYPVVALRQPVISPLYNTKNTGDVLIEIAEKIGGSVAKSFPWNTFKDVLEYRFRGLQEAKRGNIVSESFSEFWREMKEKGVWFDTSQKFGDYVFLTPSKKFEFYSQTLKERLSRIAIKEAEKEGEDFEIALEKLLKKLKIAARGSKIFLPHYEEVRYFGDEKDFPFLLNTYKLMTHAEGRGANLPFLQESLGVHVRKKWDTWVEVNPKTAKKLGISDGDEVWVESPLGRIKAEAKLYEGAIPNVVNIPFEQGHKGGGRWEKNRGSNPNWIIGEEYDYLGGLAAWFSTRVKIYKA